MDLTRVVWRRSSYSGDTNCVEVAVVPPSFAVRDSKDPDGSMLVFSPTVWEAFLRTS